MYPILPNDLVLEIHVYIHTYIDEYLKPFNICDVAKFLVFVPKLEDFYF